MLVNPSAGILGVATGKSSDHAGEAAVILYVDQNMNVTVPATVNGVRTIVIPTTAHAVALARRRKRPSKANAVPALACAVLSQAVATKQQVAQSLMQQNPAFFGVGVGQSLDNPKEAALVIYVDRRMRSRATAGDSRRPAHPLRGHGPAARDAVVCDAGPVAEPLHGEAEKLRRFAIRTGRVV